MAAEDWFPNHWWDDDGFSWGPSLYPRSSQTGWVWSASGWTKAPATADEFEDES